MTFTGRGDLTHIQLDGKITAKQLKEAITLGKEACKKIHEVQKKALNDFVEREK